jgi:hypothetical protein
MDKAWAMEDESREGFVVSMESPVKVAAVGRDTVLRPVGLMPGS